MTVEWLAKIGITGDTLTDLRNQGITGEVLALSDDEDLKDIFPSLPVRQIIVSALKFVRANK